MIATLVLFAAAASAPADVATLGIVVSPRVERSVALLRSGGRTRIVGVGDSAFGGRVVAIAAGVVSLEFATGRLDLPLAPAGGSRPAGIASRATTTPDALSHAMPRRDVERRLTLEIPQILAETALAPVYEDGQVKGLALARLPDGTLLADAGLRTGDVLTRINDVPIDSMATLVGLWPRLQNESELRAVVLRNGQPVTLTVTLK